MNRPPISIGSSLENDLKKRGGQIDDVFKHISHAKSRLFLLKRQSHEIYRRQHLNRIQT
jgi:hypothetical protein